MRLSDMLFLGVVSVAGVTTNLGSIMQLSPEVATEHYFEVRSITAERRDGTAFLAVDRVIHAPLHQSFTVRVMEQSARGLWVQQCFAAGETLLYSPETEIPPEVSLSWWTLGECSALPDGPARIITTWTPSRDDLQPTTVITEVPL